MNDSPICIRSVADLRRALTVGTVLWVERNDVLAARAARDAGARAFMTARRVVVQVGARGVEMAVDGDERGLVPLDFPPAAELRADGTNVVSIVKPMLGGGEAVLTYRIEEAGSEGALRPGDPMRDTPILTDAQIEAERAAVAQAQARQRDERMAAFTERMQRAPVPRDPRYEALAAAIEQAAGQVLDTDTCYSEWRDLATRATLEVEFACSERLPDVILDDMHHKDVFLARWDAMREVAERPRGTWRLLIDSQASESPKVCMSTGAGGPKDEGVFTGFMPLQENAAAVYENAVQRMRLDALSEAVVALRSARKQAREEAAHASIVPGAVVKGLRDGATVYSSAIVESVAADGTVQLTDMRRRGSPRRFAAKTNVQTIAGQILTGLVRVEPLAAAAA